MERPKPAPEPVTIYSVYMKPAGAIKRPSFGYSPKAVVVLSLCSALVFGAWLVGYWLAGNQVLPLQDAIYAMVSLLLAAACVIPDHVEHRRLGDSYVARLLAPGIHIRAWRGGMFCLMLAIVYHLFLDGRPEHIFLSFMIGACLGSLAWYPHTQAVWKRMWELYEKNKTIATQDTAGETPAPRT